MNKPSAELIGKSEHPLGLLYFIWAQSRTNAAVENPTTLEIAELFYRKRTRNGLGRPHADEEIQAPYSLSMSQNAFDQGKLVHDTVKQLIYEDVPVIENISFTFLLQNIPVKLREQLVRHRIGVEVGPAQGIDQIPELGKSTFWSQTSRAVPQGDFYSSQRYARPDSLDDKEYDYNNQPAMMCPDGILEIRNAGEYYDAVMANTEYAYNELLRMGVSPDDARGVLPLAATQTMTWTLNLKALVHIIGKRSCWIAEYKEWGYVIRDMVDELCLKVHPMFRGIVQPPCFSGGKFVACPIKLDNVARIKGTDPNPPCPIFLKYHGDEELAYNIGSNGEKWFRADTRDRRWATHDTDAAARMENMQLDFREQWKIDPETGIPLEQASE